MLACPKGCITQGNDDILQCKCARACMRGVDYEHRNPKFVYFRTLSVLELRPRHQATGRF